MSTKPILAALVLLALAGLAACDEAEQGRTLRYEKGTYLGETGTPLSESELNQLRQRAKQQAGS